MRPSSSSAAAAASAAGSSSSNSSSKSKAKAASSSSFVSSNSNNNSPKRSSADAAPPPIRHHITSGDGRVHVAALPSPQSSSTVIVFDNANPVNVGSSSISSSISPARRQIYGPLVKVNVPSYVGHGSRYPSRCCFTPDGSKVLAVTEDRDRALLVFDASTGACIGVLTGGHKRNIINVAAADAILDGEKRTLAVTCSQDKTACMWDVSTAMAMRPLGSMQGHSDTVLSAAFSPDGRKVATIAVNEVKCWQTATLAEIGGLEQIFRLVGAVVQCVVFDSSSGSLLFIGDSNGRVHMLDTDSGKFVGQEPIKAHPEAIAYGGLAHHTTTATGRSLLAVGCRDGGIGVFDVTDAPGRAPVRLSKVDPKTSRPLTFLGHTDLLRVLKFVHHKPAADAAKTVSAEADDDYGGDDGDFLSLVSISRDNSLQVFSVATEKPRWPALEVASPWDFAVHENTLVVAAEKSGLQFFHLAFGSSVSRARLTAKSVAALRFSAADSAAGSCAQVEVRMDDGTKHAIPLTLKDWIFNPATIADKNQHVGPSSAAATDDASGEKKKFFQQNDSSDNNKEGKNHAGDDDDDDEASKTTAVPSSSLAATSSSTELTAADTESIEAFMKKVPRQFVYEQEDLEIVAPISSGGMGTVFKAKIKSSGSWDVAVKVFRDRTPDGQRRSMIELWHSIMMRHRNIIHSYGVCAAKSFLGQDLLLIMELGECSLEQALQLLAKRRDGGAGSPVDVSRYHSWACQMAEALAYLHSRGGLSLDLKPANLLCFGRELRTLKLIDFGISKFTSGGGFFLGGGAGGDKTSTECTSAGQLTLRWAAPEQRTERTVRPTNDVWSCGCVLFFLLTGNAPYSKCESVAELFSTDLLSTFTEEALLPEFKEAENTIARKLVEVTKKCLILSYKERPRDGLAVLELLLEGTGEEVPVELRRKTSTTEMADASVSSAAGGGGSVAEALRAVATGAVSLNGQQQQQRQQHDDTNFVEGVSMEDFTY